MKRINILDIDTSNKIAAGEVVERPFSVVKELIENSLDANSKNITIEIFEGGQKSIRITDDGEGIHPDDIEKAFLPHATSKIEYIDDIYKVSTFGFRGEALASIAAVSNVIFKSRIGSNEFGKEIFISGGQLNYIRDIGSNCGTFIEVSDLFFNVPARLKFLKSSQREAALITDIVERLALVNPKVSFKLFSNNKKVLATYSSDKIIDTVRTIYGKTVSDNVTYFEEHSDIASVYGYIGNSEISRGSRANQSIFVNKRYIKNKLITTAVENAFKSFLTINKFPFFILYLDIFPELVDVNVHPTKSEIKLKDDRFIYKFIFDTVHAALRKSLKESFNIEPDEDAAFFEKDKVSPVNVVQIPIDLKNDNFKHSITKPFFAEESHYKEDVPHNSNISESSYSYASTTKTYESMPKANEKEEAKFPNLSVIGQFNDTYILAQFSEELYIIDQHAAHEKIIFEKYMEELKNKQIVTQILATPEIIELSAENYLVYDQNNEIFYNAGFNIELFGENTISIREVPIILGEVQVRNLFLQILDTIKSLESVQTADIKYDKIATLSCKAAIKANNKLSIMEMQHLIQELRLIKNPFTCPHGRPTIIKITLNELEKRFKRIQ